MQRRITGPTPTGRTPTALTPTPTPTPTAPTAPTVPPAPAPTPTGPPLSSPLKFLRATPDRPLPQPVKKPIYKPLPQLVKKPTYQIMVPWDHAVPPPREAHPMRVCRRCNISKEEEQFRRKKNLSNICRECHEHARPPSLVTERLIKKMALEEIVRIQYWVTKEIRTRLNL